MVQHGLVTDALEDITDPSDWSDSKFPQLSELDSSLRCQICKDFLKAPVLTTCGHTFCSICIRRSIADTNKCPICLEETYESGLRKVLLLDHIIKWFTGNRVDLIKELQVDHVNDSQDEEEQDLIKGTIKKPFSQSENTNTHIYKDEIPNNTSKNDSNTETLAECPICKIFMPLSEIQGSHIDQCLNNPTVKECNISKNVQHSPKNIQNFFNKSKTVTQLQPESIKNKQRLPNLDTSISTNKLRDKLNSLRLPSSGSRNQMEQRMKEYINLYNANLDSISPVNDRILIDRLNKWERLIASKLKNSSPPINADEQTIKRQKVESANWNNKNNNQYMDLIKQAKANMKKQKNNSNKDADN